MVGNALKSRDLEIGDPSSIPTAPINLMGIVVALPEDFAVWI